MEKLDRFKNEKLSFADMAKCSGGASNCMYVEDTSNPYCQDSYTRTTYDDGFVVERWYNICE
jgi:hypothetical protein